MKIKLILMLMLMILCISSSANAIPVNWTFSGGATTGGFTFDADTSVASNVSFSAFGLTYDNLSYDLTGPLGNDLFSTSTGSGLFGTTVGFLGLIPGLTNVGGMVDYFATFASIGSLNLDVGNLTSSSTVSVPEPATMTLLGLGLLGLGWTRRKAS